MGLRNISVMVSEFETATHKTQIEWAEAREVKIGVIELVNRKLSRDQKSQQKLR